MTSYCIQQTGNRGNEMYWTSRIGAFCAGIGVASLSLATTKGLNQIVTPDLQPFGQLSLSFQMQHSFLGNPIQNQYELGVSKQFEIAAFQGFRPGEAVLNSELGLIQRKDVLLSCGFLSWNTRGGVPQPFIEGGYNRGITRYMAGVQRIGTRNQAILGVGYQTTPSLLLQADYLGGKSNFITLGFTYNVTPSITFNPAIYRANAGGHTMYPYMVLTWTVTAWK